MTNMTPTTETATDRLNGILAQLRNEAIPASAASLVMAAQSLLDGRCLIREDLNGALAVNLATLDFPLKVSADGPTDEDRQTYHDFVGMCKELA